jgi:hypothetical protein
MRTTIFFLFLSLSLGSYAQDCNYAINKSGKLETQSAALAFNKDLSGIMATGKRDGNFKYLELMMFLPKKLSFDRGNVIQIELVDGRVATGIFSQSGTAFYSESVGNYVLETKVNFSDECYYMLSMVPISKIKMRANSEDIEMMPVGDSNKFMDIIRCIL